MSRNLLMADLHFGHRAILRYRTNFDTIAEHDAAIMGGIHNSVTKRDTLWLLGDCFFDAEGVEKLREIATWVGAVKFVLGNHDTDNNKRQALLQTIISENLVKEIHSMKKHAGCWLTHVPMHPAELYGKLCVHGHTHSKLVAPYDNYVCVSVEHTNYAPVNLQDIVSGHFRTAPWEFNSISLWHASDTAIIAECNNHTVTVVFNRDRRPYAILPHTTRTLTREEVQPMMPALWEHGVNCGWVDLDKLYH